jgi:Fe-S-cluster-containing dehydrogenase component
MKITRKNFLRILGGSVFAAGAGKLVKAIGGSAQHGTGKAAAPRWGMAIDFAKCQKRCTDCIRACHLAHNVPQIADANREIMWIWEEPYGKVFPSQCSTYGRQDLAASSLLVLCNHCADPPCTRVCPVNATWKRSDGVVMMDYHRCIGCRYCMAACPYGSRSFNWFDPRPYLSQTNSNYPTRTRGVVEKCNFCEERLAEGQLPACVEACSQKALVFGDLNDENSAVRQTLRARFAVQRQPELGTGPSVFYLV